MEILFSINFTIHVTTDIGDQSRLLTENVLLLFCIGKKEETQYRGSSFNTNSGATYALTQ